MGPRILKILDLIIWARLNIVKIPTILIEWGYFGLHQGASPGHLSTIAVAHQSIWFQLHNTQELGLKSYLIIQIEFNKMDLFFIA
jgi:hypothetical protein